MTGSKRTKLDTAADSDAFIEAHKAIRESRRTTDDSARRELSCRDALKVLLGGALVVGFSTTTGSWITEAQATPTRDFAKLPHLDGTLRLDEAARASYADDFGHIVSEKPLAVLEPGSAEDIARVVRFARRYGIRIVGRGQGHTTFGQSQVRAGLVVDTSTLQVIHEISGDRVSVGAGIRWEPLLRATLERGLTPPVLTDYLGLSVGGTLSVGGMTYEHGAQVDNVLELEVVTGEGKIVTCSGKRSRDLFEAALAGQGQCAVITRATLRLISAPTDARVYDVFYPDLATLTGDMAFLIDDGRFEFVTGWLLPNPAGGWVYMLEAARFFSPPDDAALLAGLGHLPGSEDVRGQSYFEFANRLADLPNSDIWPLAHPWIDPIVPGSAVDRFVGGIEQTLRPLAEGDSFTVLMIPFKTERFTRPLFRAPDEEKVVQVDILRNAPDDPGVIDEILAYNRVLYDENRDLGGTNYPISAVHLTRGDWERHYGPQWERLLRARRRHDPDNVFASGPDIFRSNINDDGDLDPDTTMDRETTT